MTPRQLTIFIELQIRTAVRIAQKLSNLAEVLSYVQYIWCLSPANVQTRGIPSEGSGIGYQMRRETSFSGTSAMIQHNKSCAVKLRL